MYQSNRFRKKPKGPNIWQLLVVLLSLVLAAGDLANAGRKAVEALDHLVVTLRTTTLFM